MTGKVEIIIGQPNEKIATFTRFALPFAFQLQETSPPSATDNLFYQVENQDNLDFIKRRKYFTRETADSLYERGQWLTMNDAWHQTRWGKAEVTVILRGQPFKIGMLPPKIVLFELPDITGQDTSSILQTGFLYVDLYFPEPQATPPQLDDLLVLNEFFRYFGIPYDDHAAIFKRIFADVPIQPQASATLTELDDLQCYFERWAHLLDIPIHYQQRYYRFFPQEWAAAARNWMYNKPNSNSQAHWQIYADNRCYVWTVVFLEKGGETLRDQFEPGQPLLEAVKYGHWLKLLNVDTPTFDTQTQCYEQPTETHKAVTAFERQWVEQRTYKRWESSGSWYGFCYHSAAILAPALPFIFSPAVTYYFDTSVLLLYIRMTLFRFGRELSAALQTTDEDDDKTDKLRQLRKDFSNFTVQYQFPMLSNQQQAIEMYEINRKFLDIDQFFQEIKQEIDNLHEFYELIEAIEQAATANEIANSANKLATSANKLATYGIPLAVIGLVATLFSMTDNNLLKCAFQNIECTVNPDLIFQTFVALLCGLGGYYLGKKK